MGICVQGPAACKYRCIRFTNSTISDLLAVAESAREDDNAVAFTAVTALTAAAVWAASHKVDTNYPNQTWLRRPDPFD